MAEWRSAAFIRSFRTNLCSEQVKRIEKLYVDEFFLLSVRDGVDEPEGIFTFDVSGSQKTRYVIVLKDDGTFKCSCPDFKSHCQRHGVVCKHIVFLIVRVMKIFSLTFFEYNSLDDGAMDTVIQKTFELISGKVADLRNEMIHEYGKASQGPDFSMTSEALLALQDEDCPICFDALRAHACKTCPDCRKVVHTRCVTKWLAESTYKNCVYCRSTVWKNFKM